MNSSVETRMLGISSSILHEISAAEKMIAELGKSGPSVERDRSGKRQ
jgi:hypothetical protein